MKFQIIKKNTHKKSKKKIEKEKPSMEYKKITIYKWRMLTVWSTINLACKIEGTRKKYPKSSVSTQHVTIGLKQTCATLSCEMHPFKK